MEIESSKICITLTNNTQKDGKAQWGYLDLVSYRMTKYLLSKFSYYLTSITIKLFREEGL